MFLNISKDILVTSPLKSSSRLYLARNVIPLLKSVILEINGMLEYEFTPEKCHKIGTIIVANPETFQIAIQLLLPIAFLHSTRSQKVRILQSST
jgi:hypothetical protein